jgi:cytochrome c biogenesis protein CcmG/thiol:disulfide interchange protein DsbE
MTRLQRTAYFAAAIMAVFTLATTLSPTTSQAMAVDKLDLASFEGRVVVIDFWASWCVPCRRSFPWLNAMQSKYADDGLVIIGVNLDRESADADKFLEQFPASFDIIYDSEADLAKRFGVQAMPSSFVIGRDGTIRNRHLGFKTKKQDEYEAAFVAALEEKAQ